MVCILRRGRGEIWVQWGGAGRCGRYLGDRDRLPIGYMGIRMMGPLLLVLGEIVSGMSFLGFC